MTKRRVVVTGAGIVSGYGIGVEPFVDGVFSGRSAVTRITRFDASMLPCQASTEWAWPSSASRTYASSMAAVIQVPS